MPLTDLVGQNVVIYGMDYAPDSMGNAPYTTGLAESLAREGANVNVIAGVPYYPAWQVSPDYRRVVRRTETNNGVTIHRRRQWVPARQSGIRRALFEGSFLFNAGIWTPRFIPDLVIGVMPSLSAGLLAARLAKRHQAPFLLILQDLVGKAAVQSGISGGQSLASVTSKIEERIVRQATDIAVIAQAFEDHLAELCVPAERIHRIHNWVHIGSSNLDRENTRSLLGLPSDVTMVLHAGNMGLKQGLENVIASARLATTSHSELLFVLMGNGNQRSHLEQVASGLPNVIFLDPQDQAFLPSILAAADVLVVNQRSTVVDMSLPSKLTSYFSSGRPVVAAVAPRSETAATISAAKAGHVVAPDDPAQLLAAIVTLATDQDQARQLGANGRDYANKHLTADAALRNIHAVVTSAINRFENGAVNETTEALVV